MRQLRAKNEVRRVEGALRHRRGDVGHARVAADLDPEVLDRRDLGVDHLAGQPVLRDAVAQHPAWPGRRLAHDDLVPGPREVVGGGEARRAGPDDEHPPSRRGGALGQPPAVRDRRVAEKPLDGADADGLVDLAPVAGGLAGVEADPPTDRGQRVVLDEPAPRRLVGPGLGVVQPALDVLASRAGVVARRHTVDVDGPLDPPRPGSVVPARPSVERDRERVLAHLDPFPARSPNRSKRPMLRSAIA